MKLELLELELEALVVADIGSLPTCKGFGPELTCEGFIPDDEEDELSA